MCCKMFVQWNDEITLLGTKWQSMRSIELFVDIFLIWMLRGKKSVVKNQLPVWVPSMISHYSHVQSGSSGCKGAMRWEEWGKTEWEKVGVCFCKYVICVFGRDRWLEKWGAGATSHLILLAHFGLALWLTWMVCTLIKTKKGNRNRQKKNWTKECVNRLALGLILLCCNRVSLALPIKKSTDWKSGRYQNRTFIKRLQMTAELWSKGLRN